MAGGDNAYLINYAVTDKALIERLLAGLGETEERKQAA